ncbi:Oidioi.mRNA.OKI2018_I69.chr2.g5395.t1.cds [Oikopleura dioica]|uniref:Oidioi.mRNA.OKI2018_I69.chr2.g5395.t1.cds n=1 Tax=Oikopleura dioica TaxID=34765 RepID=A0ABN7T6T1_OIKDI|nr:Oidioi.mRNA.OKI2018_I69.chr2.g5395.t1.cds [Oikopleura dioica]
MMPLRDNLYFRRLAVHFAGLSKEEMTGAEEKAIRNIKNAVASNMVVSEEATEEVLLPDEKWAADLAQELLAEHISGLIDDAQLVTKLFLEYRRRLDTRRDSKFTVLMGFYDYNYVVSVGYMIIGSVSHGDSAQVNSFIVTLKRALLGELDRYLQELADKIHEHFLGQRLPIRRGLAYTTPWMRKRFDIQH